MNFAVGVRFTYLSMSFRMTIGWRTTKQMIQVGGKGAGQGAGAPVSKFASKKGAFRSCRSEFCKDVVGIRCQF